MAVSPHSRIVALLVLSTAPVQGCERSKGLVYRFPIPGLPNNFLTSFTALIATYQKLIHSFVNASYISYLLRLINRPKPSTTTSPASRNGVNNTQVGQLLMVLRLGTTCPPPPVTPAAPLRLLTLTLVLVRQLLAALPLAA